MNYLELVSPTFGGKKFLFAEPRLSARERQIRRLSFRNERSLYHRKCDLSGKQIISMYSEEKPYKVYDQSEWWGDGWDPLDYGRDFDFDRPFFEQFAEMFLEVPRINLMNKDHENSEFCNFAIYNKDSYLLFTSGWCQNALYSNRVLHSNDLVDCSNVIHSELCYEVVDSEKRYGCAWLFNCSNCSDCWLGYDLKGCRDCFACFSLVNKQYCIGNKQYEREEYFEKVAEMKKNFEAVKAGYFDHLKKAVRKYINGVNFENCTGDCITNSVNAEECFEVQSLEDCKFVSNGTKMKNCYDVNNDDHSELDYETVGADTCYNQCFTDISWFNKNIYYSSLCFNSQDCFGCVGMRKNQYCIFNKQYSREEYEALVPRIIEHMKKTGEWGEFFPSSMSPFGYNETVAQDYFPLEKEEAIAQGFKWRDDKSEKMYKSDVSEEILRCEKSGKLYKVTPQELAFYRKVGVPVPKFCPDVRHRDRLVMRNARKLFDRECDNCGMDLVSSYAPDFEGKVYCKKCYESKVY